MMHEWKKKWREGCEKMRNKCKNSWRKGCEKKKRYISNNIERE